ncbi:MAG: aconitate hydratase [Deltaproteobacteria bacterium]|jgi:aconitate hydratase|nr:aconitate hydratase [Deltaproteobacteria bacterium]
MPSTLTEKIISEHLVSGEMKPGAEIGIRIDQTLAHDATGQMSVLQFEALGKPRARTKRSVIYADHNILQVTSHNADDHAFLRTAASRFGMVFSKVGNGICHQLNLERFSSPGETLLGADSHTTTGGAVGALSIGAGGLDVAVAMGGSPFFLNMPRIMAVTLTGRLRPWSTAKDVALEILRRLTVSGGRGHVLEFRGEALDGLSLTERAVIANMSIETGAFTAVFPSDGRTREFFARQGREGDWKPLAADPEAEYSSEIAIDLGEVVPLAAAPHSPDNVKPVSGLKGVKVDQVAIGSCTNSSFRDLMTAAVILKGKTVPPRVSLIVAPGSRQVYWELARRGALADLIASGARIVEAACGFCNGVGQAPRTDGISLRTSNRNFPGRSGTPSAGLYLVSPETAAASALAGEISDPRELGDPPAVEIPDLFHIDDSMFVQPAPEAEAPDVEIVRGPSIAPLPLFGPLADSVEAPVMLALGDNVTTDDILPAGAHILALRSNIPAISRYIFSNIEPDFHLRQKESGAGFVTGGANYGQGSSREHAALCPRYLGLTGVIAESFARIHQANLCNFGLLPLVFADPKDRRWLLQGHTLRVEGLRSKVKAGAHFAILDATAMREFEVRVDASERQVEMLLAGGLLALAGRSRQ